MRRFVPGRRWGDEPPRPKQLKLPLKGRGARKPPPRLEAGELREGGQVVGVWLEVGLRAKPMKALYGAGHVAPGWIVEHGQRQQWVRRLAAAALLLDYDLRRQLPHGGRRRRVRIVRSYRSIPLDAVENLPSIAKPINDALKELGWIVNDSAEWLDGEVGQVKASRPFTRVELFFEEARA